jgi:hypothetical protein
VISHQPMASQPIPAKILANLLRLDYAWSLVLGCLVVKT